MKPSPPTETNDSCRWDPLAGVIVFWGRAMLTAFLVLVGAVWFALFIRWILNGPPPPPPPWGTASGSRDDD